MDQLIISLIGGSAGSAIALLIAGYLAREVIGTRIKEAIAAEYKEKHETFVNDLKWEAGRREKAAQIADVISSWIALKAVKEKTVDPQAYIDAQRKYWELALWLDHEAFVALNAALTGQVGGDYKEALAKVRKLLTPAEKTAVSASEFVHFPLPVP